MGVIELVVSKLEVVSLVVEIVDEDYLMNMEVVEKNCLMNVHDLGTHHRQGFNHRI